MIRSRRLLPAYLMLSALLVLALSACGHPARAATSPPGPLAPPSYPAPLASLPPLPPGWPVTLELGSSNALGDVASLRTAAPFGFRYRYLAGGVNTADRWSTWKPAGSYVSEYIRESAANGLIPVFTYYELLQSRPGGIGSEAAIDYRNLRNVTTMRAYWRDLTSFYRQAGAGGQTVVLHVEPDLWGYMEQRSGAEDASTIGARVAATGISDLTGLPDSMVGFAQAVLRLRDFYAPNVIVAYHVSIWGTGTAIALADPPDRRVEALGRQAAGFYASLKANFDIVFAEFSDRDAAFNQIVRKAGASAWWDEADYARNLRFLSTFVAATGKRIVIWQIPLGNTKMRAVNNTRGHYQDNRVEWLLGDPGRSLLQAYEQAGVVAFLFGPGAEAATCACDAAGDRVTNPKPINGNDAPSLNADDDGGYFKQQAAGYYAGGALSLNNFATSSATP